MSRLHTLCLSDCPITELDIPQVSGAKVRLNKLILSHTGVSSWTQVDSIKSMTRVRELRMMDCPFNAAMDPLARRQHLIARLPNVEILNGGDPISENEREQAERAFIRYYLDSPAETRPSRWLELVAIHGHLDPLVKIDLTPETVFRVGVWFEVSKMEDTLFIILLQYWRIVSTL